MTFWGLWPPRTYAQNTSLKNTSKLLSDITTQETGVFFSIPFQRGGRRLSQSIPEMNCVAPSPLPRFRSTCSRDFCNCMCDCGGCRGASTSDFIAFKTCQPQSCHKIQLNNSKLLQTPWGDDKKQLQGSRQGKLEHMSTVRCCQS